MPDEVELAQVVREITVIEARLIAARHLKLTDRTRLLESEKRRLEARLAQLKPKVQLESENLRISGHWVRPLYLRLVHLVFSAVATGVETSRRGTSAHPLNVAVVTTARRVPNREDHDLLRFLVDDVIDQIAVFRRHQLVDAFGILRTADRGKKRQILKRAQYCISDRERCGRVTGMQILGDLCKVTCCT